ncbi:MAG: amidohydrolase [Acidimicrobiales bacterium]|nr:amidohydrolase [Acidimicrobiales bacterium]
MGDLRSTAVIDADGHILEPAWLWEEGVESRFRDRALRVRLNDAGLEYIEVDGQPFERLSPGALALLGSMGELDAVPGPERRYMDTMPLGACDMAERLQLLDQQGLAAAVLYTTLGIVWESATDDVELSDALARAYNRWIAELCRGSGGRLIAVAHLSLLDPHLAAAELERAVHDGCRGATVLPWNYQRIPHGDPYFDPLWETAAGLGVPITLHPGYEPSWCNTLGRFSQHDSTPGVGGPGAMFMSNMAARIGVQQAFTSFFAYGTFERHPGLRIGVLESGAGWIGSLLDRMESLQGDTVFRATTSMTRPASEYFRQQCFISCDPDETAAPHVVDHVGADCFVWATDYPHPDHPADWRTGLERFVEPLSAATTAKVAAANAARMYGIEVPTGPPVSRSG